MKQDKQKEKGIFKIKATEDQADTSKEEKKEKDSSKKSVFILGVVVVAVILIIVGYFIITRRTYNDYEVLNVTEIDDATSMEYEEYMDNLIKYSKDGISYINKNGETVWVESYAMKMPKAAVEGEYVAVGDLNGNEVHLFNAEGRINSITTPYTIRDIDVASQGVFAVVLDGDSENLINLYDKNGEEIATIRTTIDNSGYPVDITLSEDGKKLFTSYIYLDGVNVVNSLGAYNFGTVGQNENAERLMGVYNFDDTIIPKVEFLDNNTICAFGDNQLLFYTMKEKPSEKAKVEFDAEIKSIFYNSKYVGVILKNEDEDAEARYTLEVYNTNGHRELSKEFTIAYNIVKATEDEIIIIGDSECRIFDFNGNLKFSYSFNGRVLDVIPTNKRLEYIVVYDSSTELIRLKTTKEE